MALTYDLSKVEDKDTLCFVGEGEDRKMLPETQSVIFMCIAVGIENITKKNVDEFCIRARLIQAISGPWMRAEHPDGVIEEYPLGQEAICNHVGLKTNASPLTSREFYKKLETMALDELRRARKASKEKEAA
jgi:hypothetical protein